MDESDIVKYLETEFSNGGLEVCVKGREGEYRLGVYSNGYKGIWIDEDDVLHIDFYGESQINLREVAKAILKEYPNVDRELLDKKKDEIRDKYFKLKMG